MEKTRRPTPHFLPGLITGIAGIALFMIYYYTGYIFESNFISTVPHLVTIFLICFFTIRYANQNFNALGFGSLFGYGFKTTIIFTLVMALFMFLMISIFHEYKEKYLHIMSVRLNANPNSSEEDTKKNSLFLAGFTEHFKSIIVGGNLMLNVIAGTAGSILGAAFSKKIPTIRVDQQV